ncbi:TfoX/Sxy family protein [Xanthobacter sp. AM11]|uniref:TfoX/Sxy family protein n=1 Tax=Xanthobacter sp. AM11 TaxID=3380643 RepID=UPI0039BF7707
MDADTIADLFSAFGAVAVRGMFGGRGLFADGLMFAIEVDGIIYLKADEAFAGALSARGAVPFSYVAQGRVRTMRGYWSVPEAALDDAEDLAALSRRALALARAAAAAKARSGTGKGAAGKSGTGPRRRGAQD